MTLQTPHPCCWPLHTPSSPLCPSTPRPVPHKGSGTACSVHPPPNHRPQAGRNTGRAQLGASPWGISVLSCGLEHSWPLRHSGLGVGCLQQQPAPPGPASREDPGRAARGAVIWPRSEGAAAFPPHSTERSVPKPQIQGEGTLIPCLDVLMGRMLKSFFSYFLNLPQVMIIDLIKRKHSEH